MRRLRSEHLVLIACLVLLVVGTLVFSRPKVGGADPTDAFQGSSRFTTPSGTRALHDLLAELDIDILRFQKKIEYLGASASTLLMIAPGHKPDEAEVRAGVEWVERGGTLVWIPGRKWTAAEVDLTLERYGLASEARVAGDLAGTLQPLGGPERSYALKGGQGFGIVRPTSGVLIEDAQGGVAGAWVRRGKGRFVALMDIDFVSNGGLKTAEHAEFIVHLLALCAAGRPLAFDEYHHGFREDESASSLLFSSALGGAAVLWLLAGFGAVYARGRRLGPPVDTRDERRRRPGEAFEAFAGVAGRLKAAPQAMALILAEFQLFLGRQLGASELPHAERAAVRAGLEPGELSEALNQAQLVAAARVDEPAFLHAGRGLERVRRRLIALRNRPRRSAT